MPAASESGVGIIVPAHNEERTLTRLLEALCGDSDLEAEILVVCNGCTDDTAGVARSFAPLTTTFEIATPSKRVAMKLGDDQASRYPRVFVDADVVISIADVGRLVTVLGSGQVLACAPERRISRSGVGRAVRWYYDIWERLPAVQAGLFGRGVVAVSAAGMARIRQLPPMMSDDLVISEAFGVEERAIVDASHVTIYPPKKFGDLLRRRIRVNTGNHEAEIAGLRSSESKTSMRSLVDIAREDPRSLPKIVVFGSVWLLAKMGSRYAIRRGDYSTWKRDESSRT